tara:strand:+ start:895 stop:1509 length:615 start_codon:yes stop_codon:yes gene_type:complete
MNYKIIVAMLIIYICYNTIEEKYEKKVTNLSNDGYIVLYGNSRSEVLEELPKDYVFLDYKYTLKGCKTHIFHRDNDSGQYFLKTRHPVYTYSIYKSSGPLISLCPGSHNTTPYLFQKPLTIHGKKHTGILYNADLVHCGVLHKEKNMHYEEQYKLCHKSDVEKLDSLNKNHINDVGMCTNNGLYEFITRKLSLIFNYPLNYIRI